MRAKGVDGFELKGADFEDHDVEFVALPHRSREGQANVSAGHGSNARTLQHGGGQFGSRRFAVRPGNGDDGAKAFFEGELQFANDGNFLAKDVLRERNGRIDAWAKDADIIGSRVGIGRRAQDNLDTLRLQPGRLIAQAGIVAALANRDICAFLTQKDSRRLAAVAKAENDSSLAGVDHRSFKVARPSRAKRMDIIQNRTITVFSFQPLSSKW